MKGTRGCKGQRRWRRYDRDLQVSINGTPVLGAQGTVAVPESSTRSIPHVSPSLERKERFCCR